MTTWFWYAIVAAILYGLHQVFTKLAAEHIGDDLGGFVVETTAALTIALYLGWLWMSGKWDQKVDGSGVFLLYFVMALCRRRNDCLLHAISKRWSPLSGANGARWRRRSYGDYWHSFHEGARLMDTSARNCFLNCRFIPAAFFS